MFSVLVEAQGYTLYSVGIASWEKQQDFCFCMIQVERQP